MTGYDRKLCYFEDIEVELGYSEGLSWRLQYESRLRHSAAALAHIVAKIGAFRTFGSHVAAAEEAAEAVDTTPRAPQKRASKTAEEITAE